MAQRGGGVTWDPAWRSMESLLILLPFLLEFQNSGIQEVRRFSILYPCRSVAFPHSHWTHISLSPFVVCKCHSYAHAGRFPSIPSNLLVFPNIIPPKVSWPQFFFISCSFNKTFLKGWSLDLRLALLLPCLDLWPKDPGSISRHHLCLVWVLSNLVPSHWRTKPCTPCVYFSCLRNLWILCVSICFSGAKCFIWFQCEKRKKRLQKGNTESPRVDLLAWLMISSVALFICLSESRVYKSVKLWSPIRKEKSSQRDNETWLPLSATCECFLSQAMLCH